MDFGQPETRSDGSLKTQKWPIKFGIKMVFWNSLNWGYFSFNYGSLFRRDRQRTRVNTGRIVNFYTEALVIIFSCTTSPKICKGILFVAIALVMI